MKFLKLSLLLWSCQSAYAYASNFGYQSGGLLTPGLNPDTSNSYATALHYDAENKATYVVGATYWSYWDRIKHSDEQIANLAELDHSDCFFAMLTIPEQGDSMTLAYASRFGKSNFDEACSALSFVPVNGKTKIITAGHTDQGGFLTALRQLGAPISTVYGFLLSLELDIIQKPLGITDVTGKLAGVSLINDHMVQYPMATATNPIPADDEDEAIYVVSLSSAFKSKNSQTTNLDRPDNTAAGVTDQPDYGNHYSAFIKKMVYKSQNELDFEDAEAQLIDSEYDEGGYKETMRAGWTALLSPALSFDDISMEHYLQISDLKYVPRVVNSTRSDNLVLVGTTSGYGDAFGGPNDGSENEDDESFRYKAGFVTTFNVDGAIQATTRLEHDEQDVIIKGICYEQFGADSVDYIYVVGVTRGLLANDMKAQDLSKDASGRFSKHGFLAKLDIVSLERVWTRQLGGTLGKDVISYGCAVSPNDDVVYMAGTVAAGDTIRLDSATAGADDISSAGGDDIFVANYDGAYGTPNYIKQIGTSKDDGIAKGNGIVTDEMGNAIVLGNSRGSMMRWREDEEFDLSLKGMSSDIFLFSVEKATGAMKTISEVAGPIPEDNDYGTKGTGLASMEIMAVVLGCAIAFLTSLYMGYKTIRYRNSDKRGNDRAIRYLDNFHDEDYELHIRNSATGGVHGELLG